jgi:hypothetical protein
LYPDDTLIDRDKETRHRDRQAMLTALKDARVLPNDYPKASIASELDETLCRAVYIRTSPVRRAIYWPFRSRIFSGTATRRIFPGHQRTRIPSGE